MTQVPSTGIGSPNDLGLVPTAAGPQHPTKPTSLSPAPPPSNSGGGGGSGGEFQQTSYNGTELVMLYDYKVDLRLMLGSSRIEVRNCCRTLFTFEHTALLFWQNIIAKMTCWLALGKH